MEIAAKWVKEKYSDTSYKSVATPFEGYVVFMRSLTPQLLSEEAVFWSFHSIMNNWGGRIKLIVNEL